MDNIFSFKEDISSNIIFHETFLGGLNIEGENGVHAMKLHEHLKHRGSYKGNKSMFIFDNRIICLGSNIENDSYKYKTETTLFENSLEAKSEPIWVSGSAREDFHFNESLYVKSFLSILDNKGNGYYIPAGHRVSISKRTENSWEHNNEEAASGDFASVRIEHGVSPKHEGYEYAILTKTNLKEIKDFCHNMIFEETSLYTVLQCNKYAHVVKDKKSKTIGYAVFDCSNNINKGFIKSVDTQAMIMAKEKEKELVLSIYPRKWGRAESDNTAVSISLAGCWRLKEAGENHKIISQKYNETVIRFNCNQGAPIEIKLLESNSPA